MMNQTEKKFRMELIRILLQSGNVINDQLNQIVWKMSHVLKQYKNMSYSDVWSGNSAIKKVIDNLLNEYSGNITNHIRKQTKAVWEAAEIKNDLLIKNHIESVLVGNVGPEITVSRLYKWFSRILPENVDPKSKITLSGEILDRVIATPRNTAALDTFLERQVNGIRLSEQVWKLQETQFQPIIESYLADGVEAGKTAGEISREVRQYLGIGTY
ncbi:MAG: hypothetical protein Q8N05_05405 [Bacteroidota bacterium]|nr:hypothetical protein [Bacteroidota bacterium]